jgi:spore coat polysaccharide biosynthesis protein SpsF (cytidylyltransferase family)
MQVVAVVQARMGSTRLPGKVLMDVGGIPLLAHTLRRLAACERVDTIVVATTDRAIDDPLVGLAEDEGAGLHRGSETDVLRRIRDAAGAASADVVVRITGDCPLIDPGVVDDVVGELLTSGCDYASNVIRRTYPKGLDAEALWWDTLERLDRLATSDAAREHVTWFAYRERPDLFLLGSVEFHEDHSEIDWSVDTEEDLRRISALAEPLERGQRPAPWHDLLRRAG